MRSPIKALGDGFHLQKAFTLIELLVVVLIIGVLAAIALPQYQRAVEKARAAEAIALVNTIATAETNYYLANGQYASNINLLGIDYPGEATTYHVPGFKTKNWTCRPTVPETMNSAWTEALAACARGTPGSSYTIGKLKDGRMFCAGYTNQGEQICKNFGKKTYTFPSTSGTAYLFN